MAIRYSSNKNSSKRASRSTSIDDKGNLSRRITYSDNEGINSSTSFSLDVGGIVGPLFKVALSVVIASFIFTGAWDNRFINTQEEINTTDYLYEQTNGQLDLKYDYNIKYINYDWTTKLNQLSGLRNIFDISLFSWYDNEVSLKTSYTFNNSDYTEEDNLDFTINKSGPIYDYLYDSYSQSPAIKYLIDNDYLVISSLSYDDDWLGNALSSFSYLGVTQSYYDDLMSLKYDSLLNGFLLSKDNLIDYRVYQRDKESFFNDNLLNYLVAPITIGVNLFYDIGVIISFIVSW